MSPSVLQLQSTGLQDVFLTQNPQINIFKYSYMRYLNFATETVKVPLATQPTFGKKNYCDIPKQGHLLSKLYLHLKLPALVKNGGTYVSWSDSLGYALFEDSIDLEINGVIIDKLYPRFLDMYDDFLPIDKTFGKNLMTLKSDMYRSSLYNATKEIDLIIPLNFWFCNHYSNALPILLMDNQDVKISFTLKNFSELVNYDGVLPNIPSFIDSGLLVEYIYLDESILPSLSESTNTYMITQTQFLQPDEIPAGNTVYNTTLRFNHCVKELFFACCSKDDLSNNNHFVYQDNSENSYVKGISLLLDGKRRFDNLPEVYFRTALPFNVHSAISPRFIYNIPFSIYPEDNQPSGSINMSRFDDISLNLTLKAGNPDLLLFIYAVNYNVLTISKDSFQLEYSS